MNEVRPGAVGWRGRCGAAAIFLAVGCAYASTLGAGFAVDDERIVTHNRLIRHLGDLPTLFRRGFWDQERPGGRETSTDLAMKASYRPFTIASLSLNHALAAWLEGPSVCPHCRRLPDPPGGLDPWSYHLVNLLLHGLVSLLVADLALRLRLGPPGALFAGLLFALHPAHVDAVAWVSQRGELLSALFSVAALACHLRGAGARWAGPMFYAAALLSKESCLALPAVVWLCDLSAWMQARGALAGAPPAPVGGTGKHVPGFLRTLSWRLYAGYAGVVLAYLGVRVAVLGWLSVPAEIRYFAGVSRLDASLTVARFFTTEYLPGLLGAGVGSDYARPSYPDSGAADPLAWAGVLILVLLLSFALRGFARGSPAGLGVLMAALLLLPVTHLLAPLGVLGAARLLYLPSVGVCAFLGWGAGRAWDSGARTGRVSAALLVVAFGSATLVGARGWSSEGNAADRMLERTPDNPMALCNLASSLAAAGRGAEALPIFRQALALSPRQCVVWYNYGQLLFNLDRVDEGMEALRRGAAVDPDPSSALRLGEGRLRLRKKDLDGARQAFAEAAEMDPRSPTAYLFLADVCRVQGRWAEARAALDQAVMSGAGGEELDVDLGRVLRRTGDPDGARAHLVRAVERNPASISAWEGLGLLLEECGEWAGAESAYRRSIGLGEGRAEGHQNLGVLLRRLGRREEAEREFRRAIGLAGGLAEARKELAELLEGTDLVTAIREWEEFLRLAEVQPRFAGILEAARRHVDELRTKLAAERNSGT